VATIHEMAHGNNDAQRRADEFARRMANPPKAPDQAGERHRGAHADRGHNRSIAEHAGRAKGPQKGRKA
jgi:hypothetical protein